MEGASLREFPPWFHVAGIKKSVMA
jgi:hypothetical protein